MKHQRKMIIQKFKDERTETAMERIKYAMEEKNNQILDIKKRQRTLKSAERTYMSVQTMYLKLQVMAEYDTARKQILHYMVEGMFVANEVRIVHEERTQTRRWKDMNDRDVGDNTVNTRDVRDIDGEDEDIANEEDRGVHNDKIVMTR